MIATSICRARSEEIDFADFMHLSPAEIDRLAVRLAELLRGMHDPHLRNLAECFLADDEFMRRFARSPAGVKNHHAYPGGLLEHVVNLMEIAGRIADRYPAIDPDLLLFGAFLHDMGKIEELSSERGFSYTDAGQMLGHVVLADHACSTPSWRRRKSSPARRFPAEMALRLKHMIISHHGEYRIRRPKLPMTLEAVALHHLDNLDAKIHHFQQLMRDDANIDSAWTQFHHNLNRKLFVGAGQGSGVGGQGSGVGGQGSGVGGRTINTNSAP